MIEWWGWKEEIINISENQAEEENLHIILTIPDPESGSLHQPQWRSGLPLFSFAQSTGGQGKIQKSKGCVGCHE